MSGSDTPPGTAVCLEGCRWTAVGPTRFNDAVDHREATGHETAASLLDGQDDDTGRQVAGALWAVRQTLR